jgi:tetratricopeptide (TPR) repeat protein
MTAPAAAPGPCPECGVENAADHNYCKHCGSPLREVDVERELGTGFAERTRDRCLQLLKADPGNPSAHYNLALAYYHLGQIGNAIRAFEKTTEFDDAYPGAHFQLAVCHYRRGAMSECARAARRAIELNPRSPPRATGSRWRSSTWGSSTKPPPRSRRPSPAIRST